jgi:hypothetical protein
MWEAGVDDSTIFLVLGLCGLGVVVLGLIVFVFSIIFRFTGRNFMGFLSLLLQNAKDDEDKKPAVIARGRPNLRAIAEAQDFDAALAKHVVQDEGAVTNAELQAQQAQAQGAQPPLAPAPGFEDLSSQIAERRRRINDLRRRAASDEEDDLFGGLLEDE